VARTEEQVLDDLLNADRGISWSRVMSWVVPVVTLVVMVALMLVVLQQSAQTDRDAFNAHLREARVQGALDAAREVQAISSEQFLSFRTSARGEEAPTLSSVVDDFVQGRFIEIGAIRALREISTDETRPAADRELADLILELDSVERWIAPLSEDADDLRSDEHYLAVKRRIPDHDEAPWPMVRRRLDSMALQVDGANEGTCDACSRLLWGEDPADGTGATPTFIDPETSFNLSVWQAECLRKLPILVDRSFVGCPAGREGEEAAFASARDRGRVAAIERFEATTAWLEGLSAPSDDVSDYICDVLSPDETPVAGRRTLAVVAARAYNGLGMSLINRDEVTPTQLDEAETDIDRAICFREEALETSAQVAASRENLAVIAYRAAWELYDNDQRDLAAVQFGRARCLAEASVADNPNLPWSWTILYLTNTARASIFEEAKDCGKVLGVDEIYRQSRSRSQLWRRLSFFEPDAFAPNELPGLLPMFPEGPFNRTGYDELSMMLIDLRSAHHSLRDGSEAPWQVFMTSVVPFSD